MKDGLDVDEEGGMIGRQRKLKQEGGEGHTRRNSAQVFLHPHQNCFRIYNSRHNDELIPQTPRPNRICQELNVREAVQIRESYIQRFSRGREQKTKPEFQVTSRRDDGHNPTKRHAGSCRSWD